MQRMTLEQLEAQCQKLDHRRLGNWMARHVARPMALRVTQVLAPWGFRANVATACAMLSAVAASAAFAIGTRWAFVAGAALLQLWYLLDHVDGQLARLRRTESLDGVALDYLMHHGVHFLLPLAISHGLFVATTESLWLWLGVAWSGSLLFLGIVHDVRYKAFVQRWKRVYGELILTGGGGGRPALSAAAPAKWRRLPGFLAAKACEMHVVMNLLVATALVQLVSGDSTLLLARGVSALLATCALAVAGAKLRRLLVQQEAELEFMRWFRPPAGCIVAYDHGWWRIVSDAAQPAATNEPTATPAERPRSY